MNTNDSELAIKRIKEAISHLYRTGKIKSDKELCEMLGYSTAHFSRVINGEINKKFLKNFAHTFQDVFYEEYLVSGSGILTKKTVMQPIDITVQKSKEDVIQFLIKENELKNRLITQKDELIKSLKEENSKLIDIIAKLSNNNTGNKKEIVSA